MLLELIYLLVFIFLIDGIKLLYEAFSKYKIKHLTSSTKDVSVLIACHNEEDEIIKTLLSISKHIAEENIIVVDDGSTDNTVESMKYFYHFKGKIISIKNQGKVKAIEIGLQHVTTKYVLILDADCRLDKDFIMPTELFDTSNITAVAFNVIPEESNGSVYQKIINLLQKHEYAKSMQIGKKSKDKAKSVHCISGAGGLFITERLIGLTKKHTKIFPGEDLERTLLELYADGKVVFSESIIKTDIPKTLRELTKQRIFGWWPGLYRNLYLFVKILFGKNTRLILRLEMIYEMFSLATDIFKLIALYGLIITGSYLILVLYIVYLMFEYIIYSRINTINKNYLSENKFMSFFTILLYPLYSTYQMILRMLSFFVFIQKKFITRQWSKAVIFLLFMFSSVGYSQSVDKIEKDIDKYVIGLKYQYVQDEINDVYTNQNNAVAYVGLNNVYTEFSYGVLNQMNVGIYTGPFWIDVRFREYDLSTRLQGELWSGDFVFKGIVQPTFMYNEDENTFVSLGTGIDYFKNEDLIISALLMKDVGRFNTATLVGRVHVGLFDGLWERTTLSINSRGDAGYAIELGYKFVYCGIEYYENYDFNSYNRMFITAGLLFRIE